MGKTSIEIIKDFFISILIVACIVLLLSVIFYDKVSLGKVIPEAEEYEMSAEMKKGLKESETDSAEEVIINYYIDAADLKKYEKTNEYIKGKNNPFAELTENEIGNSDATGENNNGSSNNGNGQSGFYGDDNTK